MGKVNAFEMPASFLVFLSSVLLRIIVFAQTFDKFYLIMPLQQTRTSWQLAELCPPTNRPDFGVP